MSPTTMVRPFVLDSLISRASAAAPHVAQHPAPGGAADAVAADVPHGDLARAGRVNPAVPDALRVDDHHGAVVALVEAVHLAEHHAPAPARLLQRALQLLERLR